MQLSPPIASQSSTLDQFLQFSLLNNVTALLPIAQMAAVLKVDIAKITAIPHLPGWVMGVYNWRGEVLWILDTGYLLGESSFFQQSISPAQVDVLLLEKLAVETGETFRLGLLVNQIQGIQSFSLDEIQSPTMISDTITPFLRGYWLNAAGEMLTLLDGPAIFDCMPS